MLARDLTDREMKHGTSFTSTVNVFLLCICVDAELCTRLMDQRLAKHTAVWIFDGSILFIKFSVTDLTAFVQLSDSLSQCNFEVSLLILRNAYLVHFFVKLNDCLLRYSRRCLRLAHSAYLKPVTLVSVRF
jgi:hypothetical protein